MKLIVSNDPVTADAALSEAAMPTTRVRHVRTRAGGNRTAKGIHTAVCSQRKVGLHGQAPTAAAPQVMIDEHMPNFSNDINGCCSRRAGSRWCRLVDVLPDITQATCGKTFAQTSRRSNHKLLAGDRSTLAEQERPQLRLKLLPADTATLAGRRVPSPCWAS